MPVSTADAAHLLRRSGFGVTPTTLAEITRLSSRNAAVARVLDTSLAPTATVPAANPSDPYGSWWGMCEWWLDRMRTSPVPIVEKMTLFWHNHFVSGYDKVGDLAMLFQQHQVLRQHAVGDFHALAQDVSINPAMLLYLDNAFNFSWEPQENFARELMELFTLGVDGYTQGDVQSMARAWTGHSVDDTWRNYQNRSSWHETGESALFGLTPRSWDGPAALTEILKGSKAEAASRFVTAKVFSHFAYPVTPSDAVVAPIATAWRAAGLNIRSLLSEIFRSTAFWSTTARRSLVRSPVEWIVATMQATGLSSSQVLAPAFLERCGQTLFNPPDVSGWKQNQYWLSTSSAWGRSSFADLVRSAASQAGVFKGIETATPTSAVQQAFTRFGITEPSAVTRAALEAYVTRAKAEGDAWSLPRNLVHLLMLSPDFQVA